MTQLATGSFYGHVRGRLDAGGAILTRLDHVQGRKLPRHSHASPYYTLLIRGGYWERWSGGEIDYAPLTLVFHPPEISHTDEVAPQGGRFFMIEVSPALMSSVSSRIARVQSLEPDLVWLALRLLREHQRGEVSSLVVQSTLLELLSRTLEPVGETASGAPPWLGRILELIRERYGDCLTVEDLASVAGVHPVHLTRVFRRRFGVTAGDFVRRLRVRNAARFIAQRQFLNLADVAQQCGFADQSHFCRTFKRITGTTPGELLRFTG